MKSLDCKKARLERFQSGKRARTQVYCVVQVVPEENGDLGQRSGPGGRREREIGGDLKASARLEPFSAKLTLMVYPEPIFHGTGPDGYCCN